MTLLPMELYDRCLAHHREVEARLPHVVKDSIPIPFFGDVGAYLAWLCCAARLEVECLLISVGVMGRASSRGCRAG